jgi:enoyl-CoA hydratase/carnithine racemase
MADRNLVTLRVEDRVAILTLDRPEKLNALSSELFADLDSLLTRLADDPDVRVVVLTGAGRAFSAGADLSGGGQASSSLATYDNYEKTSLRQLGLRAMPQVVVAAVNGYCLGRGMELALWCDIVIASNDARFGEPEVRDGSFVASIVPWLANPQRAKLLMLTGDLISAREALEMGLVTEVVEGDAFPAAVALASRLANVPAPAARAVKRYVNAVADAQGLLEMQREGAAVSAVLRSLSATELGVEHLEAIRAEQGLKAYLAARDAPFARSPEASPAG